MKVIKEMETTDLSIDHQLFLPKIKIDNKTILTINSMDQTVAELIAIETNINIIGLNNNIYIQQPL